MLSYAFSERVMRTGVEKEQKMNRGLGLGQCLRMPSLVVALRVLLLTPLDPFLHTTQGQGAGGNPGASRGRRFCGEVFRVGPGRELRERGSIPVKVNRRG